MIRLRVEVRPVASPGAALRSSHRGTSSSRPNAQARLQGQSDLPLDELGLQQAKAAGAALRSRRSFDRVITTSKQRTSQTALAAGLGDVLTSVDERWTELDFGEYDGRTVSEVSNLIERWSVDDPPWVPRRLSTFE